MSFKKRAYKFSSIDLGENLYQITTFYQKLKIYSY